MDPNTETGANQPPKNDPSVTDPKQDNGNAAEVEKLRREKEQAEMRANQLANELKAKSEAEEEARRKQLEENEEYKTLYQREKEERERLENERKDAAKKAGVSTAQSEIFAKFPKEVVEVAETAGLSLADDSDEAKQQLEERLKTLADKVGPKKTPGANNPGQVTQVEPERAQILDGMRRGDPGATRQAISTIPALKKMREIAGVEQVIQ